jgi:hypothetical protein
LIYIRIYFIGSNVNKNKKKNEKTPKEHSEVKINSKEQGKFVELPGGLMGKVVVRFPPEASGLVYFYVFYYLRFFNALKTYMESIFC